MAAGLDRCWHLLHNSLQKIICMRTFPQNSGWRAASAHVMDVCFLLSLADFCAYARMDLSSMRAQ
jgi:hypothetical protein